MTKSAIWQRPAINAIDVKKIAMALHSLPGLSLPSFLLKLASVHFHPLTRFRLRRFLRTGVRLTGVTSLTGALLF